MRRRIPDGVTEYFQAQSSFWTDVYSRRGVAAESLRDRQAAILEWIDGLALTPDSSVLEVGCGAGFLAVALAQRGLRVHAVDSSEAMVALARRQAAESGTANRLSVETGDVYCLPFTESSFDLVIAVGVIPWLEQPETGIRELARVTRRGGYVVLTASNQSGLSNFLNPQRNWLLRPLVLELKDMLIRVRLRRRSPSLTLHSRRFIDRALQRIGLVKTRAMTRGFGPFLILRQPLLPEPLGTWLHLKLQSLADRDVMPFRVAGSEYIVLARKRT